MHTLPLPSLASIPTQLTGHNGDTFYPINILTNPPPTKKIKLETMVLTCPIHVHTPQAHIGTIHGPTSSQGKSALDLFYFLQNLAGEPLDCYTTNHQLTQQMRAEIGKAFMRRNERSSSSVMAWEAFTSGQSTPVGGPIGEDLLLGNVNLWGVEERSVGGYSVLHLA